MSQSKWPSDGRTAHVHHFEVGDRHYGNRTKLDEVAAEKRMTLNALVKDGTQRFSYTYEFGDD